jgi:hypothetical protein
VSRFEHAFGIALLLSGCVPTDEAGKPAPEGTTPTPAAPAAAGSRPRLNLPTPIRPTPLRPGSPRIDGQARHATPPPPVAPTPSAPAPAPAAAAAPAKAEDGPPDAVISSVFLDFFERPDLGPQYNPTSPVWRIDGGKLCGRGARNHPVWLRRKLPTNARIEFDAMSSSPDGDLKVEMWGDGKSFAKGTSYNDATSYLAIFGGWKNGYHVLARIDEHAKDRPEVKVDPSGASIKGMRVMPNRWYHFKIERNDGKTVRWLVDDIEILSYADPNPLKGEGHQHVGFNDWDVPVCFDNLKITPLGE